MKKNRMMRLASILLVCVLLTTSVISGTFAKYTTTQSVQDTARVAKWDIDFAGKDNTTKDFAFDLFNTVNGNGTGDESGDDNDVANVDGQTIIAPGTSGSFEISLVNNSEVNAKYTIAYTVYNGKSIPVEFKVGDGAWNTDLTAFNANDIVIGMNETASITVYWKWEYEGNDAVDTPLGVNGAEITVKAEVAVTQVN